MPAAKPEPKEKAKTEKPKDSVREKSGPKEKMVEHGKKKEKEKAPTVRMSTSSEVGALTASLEARKTETQTLGKKKISILGVGRPSSMRMSPVRIHLSAASTIGCRCRLNSRRFLEEVVRGRQYGLHRPSGISNASRDSSSSGGSTASVKWDEECLESVKEMRRKNVRRERKRREQTWRKNRVKELQRSKKNLCLGYFLIPSRGRPIVRFDILNIHF